MPVGKLTMGPLCSALPRPLCLLSVQRPTADERAVACRRPASSPLVAWVNQLQKARCAAQLVRGREIFSRLHHQE
jgi:hypothetical protein